MHRHPFERASNVGPRVPAQGGFHRLRAGGRSPLGAPPRRFIGAEPAWAIAVATLHIAAVPIWPSHWLRSHVPPVVAGGRCRSVASRASVCMHRLAGRRIPSCFSNASRKHPRRTGHGKVGEQRRSVQTRYPRNACDIASVKCGACRQGATASIVFAVSLSQSFFAHRRSRKREAKGLSKRRKRSAPIAHGRNNSAPGSRMLFSQSTQASTRLPRNGRFPHQTRRFGGAFCHEWWVGRRDHPHPVVGG